MIARPLPRPACIVSIAALAFASSFGSPSPAVANPSCVLSNFSSLEFDSRYDPFAGEPADGRAGFTVRCSRPTTVTLSLLYSHRLIGGPGAALHYDLFATPERLTVWGSGSDGAAVTRSFPAGPPTTVYVYARIPAGQKAAPGAFHDNFTVVTEL